jgi:hypothetical protein
MRKAIAVMAMVSLTGCSAFRDQTQQVKLICSAPETLVIVDGKRVDCPSTLEMPRDRSFTVQAYKEGRLPVTRTIGYHLSDAGQADVLGTFVFFFPIIGLAAPGAWDLDAEEIELTMIDPKNIDATAPKPTPAVTTTAGPASAPEARNSQGNKINAMTGALIQ